MAPFFKFFFLRFFCSVFLHFSLHSLCCHSRALEGEEGKKNERPNRRLHLFIERVNRNVFETPIPPLTDYKFYFMHIFLNL